MLLQAGHVHVARRVIQENSAQAAATLSLHLQQRGNAVVVRRLQVNSVRNAVLPDQQKRMAGNAAAVQ